MTLLQQQVTHKQFGVGQIVAQTEQCITVQFPAPTGEKRFLFPDAFSCFLTLENPTLQEQVAQLLAQQQAARLVAQLRQEHEQALHRAAVQAAAVATKKKAAAAKRAATKAKKAVKV